MFASRFFSSFYPARPQAITQPQRENPIRYEVKIRSWSSLPEDLSNLPIVTEEITLTQEARPAEVVAITLDLKRFTSLTSLKIEACGAVIKKIDLHNPDKLQCFIATKTRFVALPEFTKNENLRTLIVENGSANFDLSKTPNLVQLTLKPFWAQLSSPLEKLKELELTTIYSPLNLELFPAVEEISLKTYSINKLSIPLLSHLKKITLTFVRAKELVFEKIDTLETLEIIDCITGEIDTLQLLHLKNKKITMAE